MARCAVRAACLASGAATGATTGFVVPMHDFEVIETLHERAANVVSGDTAYNHPSAIVGRVPSHGGSRSQRMRRTIGRRLSMNHGTVEDALDVQRSAFDVRCSTTCFSTPTHRSFSAAVPTEIRIHSGNR
jgi:hypothetical protein